jgi:hypothetical protein
VGSVGVGSIDGSGGWATKMWAMLSDGGVWGVPRCGLIYRKHEADMKFVLFSRMPWEEGMPMTREELSEFQADDHEGITRMFASIGVEVVDDSWGMA